MNSIVTHVYSSLEEIAERFDEIAEANRQYHNNATTARDRNIYRERANTWRDAATHLRMSTLALESPAPEQKTESPAPRRRLRVRRPS